MAAISPQERTSHEQLCTTYKRLGFTPSHLHVRYAVHLLPKSARVSDPTLHKENIFEVTHCRCSRRSRHYVVVEQHIMKIISRYYYDQKHQRWVVEYKVAQYFDLRTTKEVLEAAQAAMEAKIRA
jgi:hypothetical protein